MSQTPEAEKQLYQVRITLTGSEDPIVSTPMDKYTAENLMLNIADLATKQRGVIAVNVHKDRLPVNVNPRYIDTWFMTVHDPAPPF